MQTTPKQPLHPPEILPEVSLELRLRWLEILLLGLGQDATKERSESRDKTTRQDRQQHETLYRKAEDLQRRLDVVITSNDGLRRFMEHYDRHAQFLTPSFALSGLSSSHTTPPSYDSMSPAELEAFLSEMESDIRAADRDLLEIDTLEKRGVTAAGKLTDYGPLQARLQTLVRAHKEDVAKASSLENRIAALLETHATKVDSLSELFVAWNDVITEAEDRVNKAERGNEERRRLGFE